jgi:hypothetical protein
VELVRQYIPFADKLINKIAESSPVQGLMKPLDQPMKSVGGMIDQVSERAVGVVEDSEQKAVTTLGSGAKLLTGLAGAAMGAKAGSDKGEGKKDEKGGDFLGSIKGGIHTRLLAFGQKLLKSGKALLMKGVDKLKGMLTPKVKFKLGNEDHELWVAKGSFRNIVMMASEKGDDILKNKVIIREMEENPELRGIITGVQNKQKVTISDVEVIKKGLETGFGGVSKTGDYNPRISEVVVRFKRNPKHDAAEFERQLKGQEKGLNSLTVYEFLQNRDRYIKEGRAPEGNAAQKAARERAKAEKITELRKKAKEQGKVLSYTEAENQVSEWIKGQAALHNPDQIAGGNPLDITGMGDTRINSSLGSQWKNNIGKFDMQVRNATAKMTDEQKRVTRLNVKLLY